MYDVFASYYDALTGDVDYAARSADLLALFDKYDRRPTLLLDLACGTGGFSLPMAQNGLSVIGVDLSPDMLAVAREKAAEAGLDILFLCQDATELDLFGTVDGAICGLDSLNHLPDYGAFCLALARTALFLEPGRLFLFDLNTPYKHREVLGNNTFARETDGIFCVWQSEFFAEDCSVSIALDFFSEQPDGSYCRESQDLEERAYSKAQVAGALANAGLCPVAELDADTLRPPTAATERILYVTRKLPN